MLRKYDYSETSQILRLLTRESGTVSVLAKGTKKEKSGFGGALDLFYRGEAIVLFRPRSGLHILTAFHVADFYPALRDDLSRFYAACHLVEILIGMTREEEPNPELYDTTVEGLALLVDSTPAAVPAVLLSVELLLLGILGFSPRLEACAACGGDAPTGAVGLSPELGGVLCPDCTGRDPRGHRLSPGAISSLRAIARGRPDRASRVRLSPADAGALRAWLTAFEEWNLERPLRAARFL